ncbi:sodium/hydrogen exchanger 3 family protein [Onchocerca flexuosa]|uniref:Sodium/hydrogen exchanger n=1 Tax=Onchocerca flexuosa TaxID=387005 RepID=A0A238BWP3_9BILA|nr:sodium/hydrogen exchanger 3 family protein [Onchocerca flexuosa]
MTLLGRFVQLTNAVVLLTTLFTCSKIVIIKSAPAKGLNLFKFNMEKENEKLITSSTEHGASARKHHEISLFKFQWEHVSTPLAIAFWFFTVTIMKIIFHRFQSVHSLLPDSALLIVLGLFFGYVFHLVYPDEQMYLKPDWFFLYLLPPIALDAGYFMPNKNFFRNFGTIMTYAVLGTLWNVFAIGLTLYFLHDYFKVHTSLIELLLFSTLISAVDPVAVLCVFEEIHVNQLLYICVFGESLLNDAVTIVLYQTLNAMVDEHGLTGVDYVIAISSFFVVSIGGLLIGLMWAIFTGFTTKHSQHLNVVQPLICLLFPYLAYLTAEMVAMSGILAIVICGLAMKQFVVGNLSRKSLVTVQYFMKTLSSSCEALIFVYLGISAVSKNHDWDAVFIVGTLISCLIQRFIGVFFFTYILNMHRVQKIDLVDQFIMSYGGIRGAVCYGLVMSLDPSAVKAKNMFASCTVIVILFTVFVQGGTIKRLVQLLEVKQNEVHKKTVFEMVSENVINNMMAGVEGISGYRGQYWYRQAFNKFAENYVKPYLMSNSKSGADRLVDYHEHIQVKEAVHHLKVHGSFVGLPTAQSKVNLEHPVTENAQLVLGNRKCTKSDLEANGLTMSAEMRIKIPRNESISLFLRDKFNELNSPVSTGVYSRHLLDVDNTPRTFSKRQDFHNGNSFDALDSEAYHMTYPYCKNARIRRHTTLPDAIKIITRESLPSSKPRFLITSEPDPASPPIAPRYSRRKSAEQDLQEKKLPREILIGLFSLVIEMGIDRKWSSSNLILPGETTTEKFHSEERPRKLSAGFKASLTKDASEKMTLTPVHEDDENIELSSSGREKCS